MIEQSTQWAGDFLLLFGHTDKLPAARSGGTWRLILRQDACALFLSAPTEKWRGSPLFSWQDANRQFWQMGVVWGEKAEKLPTDWPGHYALLALDNATNHWHLWTNRCSTFHVYYGRGFNVAALGTFSPAVSALTPRTLDTDALAGFFSLGFFPSDRTHHKEVQIIRPATHFELDTHGSVIKQERLWHWRHEPNPQRTFDATVDEFAEIFHQVIGSQLYNRSVAFPISGGLDSRSTIAALPSEMHSSSPWSYSYGFAEDSVETHIAAKIAAARDLPFNNFTVRPYLFNALPMVVDSLEGFQDITQARQAFVVNDLAAHADYVMAAHWGDVWLDDMGTEKQPHKEFLDFAATKFIKQPEWLLKHIIQPLAPRLEIRALLRETLSAETQRLGDIVEDDFRLKALKTEMWSFRWTTASLRMYQPGAFPLLPFYDPRLIDFFCTVPTAYVRGRRLQIEYLKRYAADLARVPWQVFDANLYWYPYFNSLLLPKRAMKKSMHLIRRKAVLERNWEVQYLSPGGREHLEGCLLANGLSVHTLVSQVEIGNLIKAFYASPSPAAAYSLSMLLTFSTWLERHG